MISRFKIINDPVHGFINIPSGTVQEIIEHPYFQRLRDIKQLGFTNLVYPGATHSRLSHALGSMHLMQEAVTVLRLKGVEINEVEEEAALSAILMGPIITCRTGNAQSTAVDDAPCFLYTRHQQPSN